MILQHIGLKRTAKSSFCQGISFTIYIFEFFFSNLKCFSIACYSIVADRNERLHAYGKLTTNQIHRTIEILANFTEVSIESDVKVIDRDFDLTKCSPIDGNAKNDLNILVFGDDYMVCQYLPRFRVGNGVVVIYTSMPNKMTALGEKHYEFITKRYEGVLNIRGEATDRYDFIKKFMEQNVLIKQDTAQQFVDCKDECSCSLVYTMANTVLTIAAMKTSAVLRLNGNIDKCTLSYRGYLMNDFYKKVNDEWEKTKLMTSSEEL